MAQESSRARTIAVSNQKGGVGKTTSVVNLAAFCALAGRSVLVVDNDPQANASSVLASDQSLPSVYGGGTPQDTMLAGLSVIAAGSDLLDEEHRLTRSDQGRLALRSILSHYRDRFDLIIIDCPPNLSALPLNALLAADLLLVPLQAEYYAMEGLAQLLTFVEDLRNGGGAGIELAGVLLTLHDEQLALARRVEADVRLHFGPKAFASVIPRDVALAEAPSHGQTILDYAPLSAGGLAYLSAAKELLHVAQR
jgi:chromosome partitioning protein